MLIRIMQADSMLIRITQVNNMFHRGWREGVVIQMLALYKSNKADELRPSVCGE